MLSLSYLQKLKESPALQELEWYKCKNDLAYFVFNWAITLDWWEESEDVYKNFPNKDYLKIFIEKWLENQILLVPKSRQVMASWIAVCSFLWLAQFRKWKLVFFQSKKESDANDLVKRAKTIYDNEPSFLKRYYENWEYVNIKVNPSKKWGHIDNKLEFPEIASEIRWIPQWGDQVRMQTLAWLLMDEAAFQPEAARAFEAALPALGKHWKLTLLSTASANTFFENAVFDALDSEDEV